MTKTTASSVSRGEPPPLEDGLDLSEPDPRPVFGRLFDEHGGPLHGYLTRRVGEQTADDLVSETFLVALQQRHTYDPARAGVRPTSWGHLSAAEVSQALGIPVAAVTESCCDQWNGGRRCVKGDRQVWTRLARG